MLINIHFTRNIHGKVLSKAIQWYEGVPISHCCIEVQTQYGPIIYHSNFQNGVSIMPKFRFIEDNEIMETYSVHLSKEDKDLLEVDIFSSLGEKYAVMQNLGIVIVDTFRRLGLKVKNPWKDGKNCSELVYTRVLPNILPEYEKISPDLVKPTQIRNILKERYIEPTYTKIEDL